MGMFFRALAPKPLKTVRRATHPISAVTPRPLRKAKMAAVNVANPAGAVKRSAERQVVRSFRTSGSGGGGNSAQPTSKTGAQATAQNDTGSPWSARHAGVTMLSDEGRAIVRAEAAAAIRELGGIGESRTLEECMEYQAREPGEPEQSEFLASLTESYAQGYDEIANRLRAGGAATAVEIACLEEAVRERHDELVAEARAMSDGFLRMELASLMLQERYVDKLHPNQVMMFTEQLEILLREVKSRGD